MPPCFSVAIVHKIGVVFLWKRERIGGGFEIGCVKMI